jgi:hypothetical protein
VSPYPARALLAASRRRLNLLARRHGVGMLDILERLNHLEARLLDIEISAPP